MSEPVGTARRSLAVLPVAALAVLLGLGVARASPPPTASPPPPVDWGPLAVLDDPEAVGDLDVGLGPGRLRVTERCVLLRTRGGHEDTLAWRSGDTSWDPLTRQVVYADDDSGTLRLSDGDRLSLGGYGGGTLAEPAGGPPMVWLVEPDPACPPTIFAVHEVRLLEDAPLASLVPSQGGPVPSQEGPTRGCLEDAYARPDGASLRSDLEAAAIANGWTLAQAEVRHCSSEAVGRVATAVARDYPDRFVGSVVADDPLAPPSLLVKGVAPQGIRELLAAESAPIVLVERQPFSHAELEARQARVHGALRAMGFAEVATSIAIERGGIIPASVLRTPGVPDDVATILAALPADLRDSVELEVYDEPSHGEDEPAG